MVPLGEIIPFYGCNLRNCYRFGNHNRNISEPSMAMIFGNCCTCSQIKPSRFRRARCLHKLAFSSCMCQCHVWVSSWISGPYIQKKRLQIRHPNISQYALVSSFFKPAGVYKQHYTTIYIYCKCTSTLTKYVTETGICRILIFVWYLDMAVGFASRHVILTTPIPLCWDEKNPKTPQRRKQCSRKPGKNSWNCLFDLIFGWGLVVLGRDQPFDLWKF